MPQKKRIVLGSESRWRADVLWRMDIKFDVLPANIDERAIRDPHPAALTALLADAKARAVAGLLDACGSKDAVIIAADQVVVWDGEIREKPADMGQARRFLEDYGSGEPVMCVTSVCVIRFEGGKVVGQSGVTDTVYVELAPIPEPSLISALMRGDVLKSSGALVTEDSAIARYVRRIYGDHGEADARTSVLGLPRHDLSRLLRECDAID